jgi:hypothetical protein
MGELARIGLPVKEALTLLVILVCLVRILLNVVRRGSASRFSLSTSFNPLKVMLNIHEHKKRGTPN